MKEKYLKSNQIEIAGVIHCKECTRAFHDEPTTFEKFKDYFWAILWVIVVFIGILTMIKVLLFM